MSEKDYYKILGVNRDATSDEIKKAFRKKSLICHPDKNGTGEDTEFKLLNEAYDTLGSDKRDLYDNPHNNSNMGNFQGFSGDMFEDLMRNHMNVNINMQQTNQNENIKRQNHIHKIKISLRDVHYGVTKTLKLTIKKQCFQCKIKCTNCNGNGKIVKMQQIGPFIQQLQSNCDVCNGIGLKKSDKNCIKCDNGLLCEYVTIKVDIKKNINDKETILYKNLGEQILKPNEEAGDLIIEINIESDTYFKRNDNNLVYTSKITLAESIVGKDIIVPHFDEHFKININTFGIINPSKMYTLKNKGLGGKGNLDFIFQIIYPEKILDNNERESLICILKNIKLLE
jgi:DnaJ-class molecular chaperone